MPALEEIELLRVIHASTETGEGRFEYVLSLTLRLRNLYLIVLPAEHEDNEVVYVRGSGGLATLVTALKLFKRCLRWSGSKYNTN